MADIGDTPSKSSVVDMLEQRERLRAGGTRHGSGGGGGSGDMEQRVKALEDSMKEVRASLDKLRDGQHAAALAVEKLSGDMNTKLAEIGGKLSTISTFIEGHRRETDRLPTKYDVTLIMIAVIGGLGGAALLIKNVWPLLSGVFGGQ